MKTSLQTLSNGSRAIILSIPMGGARCRLEALGLRPGKVIKKISGMPFGGPVTILLDGRQIAIGFGCSKKIEVRTTTGGQLEDYEY